MKIYDDTSDIKLSNAFSIGSLDSDNSDVGAAIFVLDHVTSVQTKKIRLDF